MHKTQRVNVNAWIDEGIPPIVVALNRFQFVQTISSCEGERRSDRYVDFIVHEGKDLYEFTGYLVKELNAGLTSRNFRLRIEWLSGMKQLGALYIHDTDIIDDIAKLITELSTDQ